MKKDKYHFEGTMMDERLIGEYKDEIKLDIAQTLDIELEPDARVAVNMKEDLAKNTRDAIKKIEKHRK